MRVIPFNTPAAALVRSELMTSLRRTRSFLILAVFVGAGIFIVVGNWPRNVPLNEVAFYSRQMFEIVTVSLMVGAALFVPALAAGAIVVEKERQTFDLLALTLIRPSGIVMAKLLNSVGFFILLIVSCLPVMGVCFFLIGLDWTEIVRSFATILLTTVTLAVIGIMCSALCRRTFLAIICSFLGMLAFMICAPLWLIAIIDWILFEDIFKWFIENVSPFGLMLENYRSLWDAVPGLVYQLTVIAVCWRMTLRVLRRPPKPPKVPGEKPIDDPRALKRRRRTFPFYLIDPLRRKKPIGDRGNPMLAKEMRWGMMNRSTVLVRVFYTALVIYSFGSTAVMIMSLGSGMTAAAGWLLVELALTVIVAPALMANALTKEYELGNMDMLRTTLLTPTQIVLGKLCAGAVTLAPIVLAALCSCLPLLIVIRMQWDLLFTAHVTLLVCCFVSLSLGLFASLLTRRTTTALVLTYLFSSMTFIGMTFVMVFVCDQWLDMRSSDYERFVFFLSPIVAFGENMSEHARWYGSRRSTTSLISVYWISNVVVFTVFAWILIALSLVGFKRFRMRDQ